MRDETLESVSNPDDLGDYCRQIEGRLSRVNAGNLVRVFGPAFELVRGWHRDGIPLSIVFRAIEQKAERHQAGQSKRPLRLEFCQADVESLFADWRRALGVQRAGTSGTADSTGDAESGTGGHDEVRRPSLTRQLDRAIQKLSMTVGRVDAPEAVLSETSRLLDALSALRDASKRARGDAKRGVIERARALDGDLARLARLGGQDVLVAVEAEAVQELAPFRGRLTAAQWQQSVDANVDRLLRARLGLPVLDIDDLV